MSLFHLIRDMNACKGEPQKLPMYSRVTLTSHPRNPETILKQNSFLVRGLHVSDKMKYNIFHKSSSTLPWLHNWCPPIPRDLEFSVLKLWNIYLNFSVMIFLTKDLEFLSLSWLLIWDSQLYEFREVSLFIHLLKVKKIIGLNTCQNNFVKYGDRINHPNY